MSKEEWFVVPAKEEQTLRIRIKIKSGTKGEVKIYKKRIKGVKRNELKLRLLKKMKIK